ncbi:MAG: YcjX family protein [Pirellulaceae bacterium]|nr:YcjX family protein [Pirellulaceae bacterium]
MKRNRQVIRTVAWTFRHFLIQTSEQMMRPPKIFSSKHNIAVVGLYRSGKTVFITSLINHLMHHRRDELKIGDGSIKITFDEELPTQNGFARFPYQVFRYGNNGRWPTKTKATFQYRCTFFRSDWGWIKGELSLVDIPGERLSDIAIAKLSFDQWSDRLLQKVFQDSHYRDAAQTYQQLASDLSATEESVVASYRELLAKLYRSFRPIISPSTFLLTAEGQFNGTSIMGGDHSSAFCGLSADLQFAPLPQSIRQSNPELSKIFANRYADYRKKLAAPLVKSLSRCNEMVVLLDVTTLLAANTGMYNGNRALLELLFEILSPGKGLLGTSLDLLRMSLGGRIGRRGISKIAMVATKADKVHDSQRDKLVDLARDMSEGIVERQRQRTNNLDCRYFACAAVKSTFSQANGTLRGNLLGDDGPVEYAVSGLPSRWPGKWNQGEFVFPDVAPLFPENAALAPDHLGMDHIIDFLMKSQV